MINEESYALEQGSDVAARVLAGSKMDEVMQRIALEAARAGIHAALAIYAKHIPVTMQATGQMITPVEREAVQLLYKAAALLQGEK